jgi:GNAT superfamily N-acetyltransferase
LSALRYERRTNQSLDGLKRDSRGRWHWGGEGPFIGFAVVALDGIREVGRFQFAISSRGLVAKGTYVKPAYRRRDVAVSLWKNAIEWKGARAVHVACVSVAGLRLVEALQRELPRVRWTVFDDREDVA